MSIRETASSELKKLRDMPPRDRLWYLGAYYKFHLAALIIILVLLSVVGQMIYRSTFTTRLSFAVVNDRSGGAGSMDVIKKELHQYLKLGSKDLIEINEGLSADFQEDAAMSEFGYASLMKITALTASGGLDIMIADREAAEHFAGLSAFEDLSQLLPQELLAELSDAVLYLPDENGHSRAAALSLEGTSFSQKTGIVMDSPCLAVMSNSPHKEEAVQALRLLIQ